VNLKAPTLIEKGRAAAPTDGLAAGSIGFHKGHCPAENVAKGRLASSCDTDNKQLVADDAVNGGHGAGRLIDVKWRLESF